ncbi:MAG: hypothetical protein Q7T05_01625 [Dehalococcoidia bacterium]|nr:hypothetical protein [Dehalococcoidia bacterium]
MSRDLPGHEKKKQKKDLKKPMASPSTVSQPVEVEVVRKRRKKDGSPE